MGCGVCSLILVVVLGFSMVWMCDIVFISVLCCGVDSGVSRVLVLVWLLWFSGVKVCLLVGLSLSRVWWLLLGWVWFVSRLWVLRLCSRWFR